MGMFQTIKEQPKAKARRSSFLSGAAQGSHESLPEDKPQPVVKSGTGKKTQRGSIKEVQNAFGAMSVFDSAIEEESHNPLFTKPSRFGSVRGSANKKKKFVGRTTTRDKINVA